MPASLSLPAIKPAISGIVGHNGSSPIRTDLLADAEDAFQARRRHLLHKVLAVNDIPEFAPDLAGGLDHLSHLAYVSAYRLRIEVFHARLLTGIERDSAREFFELSGDFDSERWNKPRNEPDWKMRLLIRTWFECGKHLSEQGRERVLRLMKSYRAELTFGGTENHIVTRVAHQMLIDQILAIRDDRTRAARDIFMRWVWKRGHCGFTEFNSPGYHGHSLQALLLIFDHLEDEELRTAAQMAADLMLAAIAAESIRGTRGGPWHRATSREQIVDARADVAWMVDFVFFGNVQDPSTLTDAGAWLSTRYRAPEAVRQLAMNIDQRGVYDLRTRADSERPSLDAWFHMTPSFCLASFQDSPPFQSCYMGSTNASNLQPWELTFADPQRVLGVARSLDDLNDYGNQNTSVWQHANVLIFRGAWMDYNGNLGTPLTQTFGRRRIAVLNVTGEIQDVWAAFSSFEGTDLSVLEVVDAKSGTNIKDWMAELLLQPSMSMHANHCYYSSSLGVTLEYRDGQRLVDGCPLTNGRFPLFDSPFIKSEWNSGRVSIEFAGHRRELDFRSLPNKAGQGLRGSFFRKTAAIKPELAHTRIDPQLEFRWGNSAPCIGLSPNEPFEAKWTGFIVSDRGGLHEIRVRANGTIQLEVSPNGEQKSSSIIKSGDQCVAAKITCCTGQTHSIQIHYTSDGIDPFIKAEWGLAGEPLNAIGLSYEAFPD